MLAQLRPALVLFVLLSGVTGLLYPLVVFGAAQALFPAQANGSLLVQDGRVIGSSLIGQSFASPRHFQGRPSAAGEKGYDALASSGSNLGPTAASLVERVKGAVEAARADGVSGPVPADLVTASGSGLDPHLSPGAALAQVDRVARARGLAREVVAELVRRATEERELGFLGEPRVNVLALNRSLDAAAAKAAAR
ncbi:MAG: potassium-transporting ATPase subunit KdpC [Methylobacteriaceae bacterium]|nr:potassium-transporting ATPase subunit KdpC [Methylobacteriaceae bacterium]